MIWYSYHFKNLPQFVLIHTVKSFGINNEEIDFSPTLELSCHFDNFTHVGYLIFSCSAFIKSSLNIRNFMVHVLLKPGLENFEHYFASIYDEGNCMVV